MTNRQRRRKRERRRGHERSSRGRSKVRGRLVAAAGVALGSSVTLAAPASPAQALQYTVTSHNDSSDAVPSPGTLRRAVFDANANPGPDSIVFASNLTGAWVQFGPIQITEALSIQGPGAGDFLMTAFSNSRFFTVNPVVSGDPVTISGLRLANGYSASSGGAILNQDSKLTVRDSEFSQNESADPNLGGGAIADAGGHLGGSQTTIEGSAFTRNYASAGSGGAVAAAGQLGTVVNSTFGDNYAYDNGGAVVLDDDGGVFQNVTIARNEARGNGGGVAANPGGPNLAFQNSIVGANVAHGLGDDLAGSDPTNAEFSLFGSTSAWTLNSTVPGSNILNLDPGLQGTQGPTDNGGETATYRPAPGSPVIDQGKTAGGVTTDQRGEARPYDALDIANGSATGADAADMGAVELNALENTPADLRLDLFDAPDPVLQGRPITYTVEISNDGPYDASDVEAVNLLPNELVFRAIGSSPGCTSEPDPPFGSVVTCLIDSVLTGSTETRTVGVDTLAAASLLPYVTNYGYVTGAEFDPAIGNNYAYADTVVEPLPQAAAPVPTPAAFDLAAAVKKCKKKFKGKAKSKKRKKCIKKAKKEAASSARETAERGVYQPGPFVLRHPPPVLSASGRLGGRPEGVDRRRDIGS
jgi:uncharacterized repeat protein (TIGR01451 family)